MAESNITMEELGVKQGALGAEMAIVGLLSSSGYPRLTEISMHVQQRSDRAQGTNTSLLTKPTCLCRQKVRETGGKLKLE